MLTIYLDYNASTPIDQMAAAMRPFLDEAFGNPSSCRWASMPARTVLEQARGRVATLLGAAPDNVLNEIKASCAPRVRQRIKRNPSAAGLNR